MSIKWTKTALQSVDQIAGYFANDNPACVSSFMLELLNAVTKLQNHPGTRELVLRKNCIDIYRVRGDDFEILRSHHVARNL